MARHQVINLEQWTIEQPQDGAEPFTILNIDGGELVDIEVRCAGSADLFAVDTNGQLVWLESGQHIRFRGQLLGAAGIQISARDAYAFVASSSLSTEFVDPRPMVVIDRQAPDPIKTAVQDAIRETLGRLRDRQAFRDDESVMEFLDDLENGDLDLDDEPEDDFGGGFMEAEDFEAEEGSTPSGTPSQPPAQSFQEGVDASGASDTPARPPATGGPPKPAAAAAPSGAPITST